MASYSGNIDLLQLNGAKVLAGLGGENDKRPYVCIPCDVNEIRLEANRNDPNRQMAKLRISIWPFNENYKNVTRRSNAERGDANKEIATHELQMNFSVDYIKAVAKNFPKLVEQVKEANKEKDPAIVSQDFNDENSHLFKAIRQRMNKRLASLYQPKPTNRQSNYPQQTYNTAMSGATAYVPPADGYDPANMPGYDDPNSDLPF